MPEEGVVLSPADRLLSSDEIVDLSSLFVKRLGVNKIRLTGGEPLVRKDFFEIASRISSLKPHGLQTLAVTTNGIALSRRVHLLKQSGNQITQMMPSFLFLNWCVCRSRCREHQPGYTSTPEV